MKYLLFISFIVYPCLSWSEESCNFGKKLSGSYVIEKAEGYLPNQVDLVSKNSKNSMYKFELDAYWSSRPNDDGSFTSQAYYGGNFKVKRCIAKYYSSEDNCNLTFVFDKNTVTISHYGMCGYIGHNVTLDGVYVKK
jgi:hypothetical protein